jgi:hypothetical protein
MNEKAGLVALVVHESFFGNTENIARAVARGLELGGMAVTVVDAEKADSGELDGVDLLVVGGPTHAFALSRPTSRDDAVARGGTARYASRGLREWLSVLPIRPGTHLAAAFDTRVKRVRHLPASAAASAGRLLRRRDFTLVDKPTGFIVQDITGPLEAHETERAVRWGSSLAQVAQTRIAAEQSSSPASGSERPTA